MKRILNKLPRNERGVVLIIVLILLAVGGLTIAPMLSHMSTGLKAGQTYEKKTGEYYAADAGVEDALWQITREPRTPDFPSEVGNVWPYYITDEDSKINGKDVYITIEYYSKDASGNDVYKIDSIATGDGGGSTAIESYVIFGGGFLFLLDNAVTSTGQVDLKNNSSVVGGILSPLEPTGNGVYDEWIPEDVMSMWPSTDDMLGFYRAQVTDTGILDYTIDSTGWTFDNPLSVEPLYVGGKLTLQGDGWIRLNGTVFVTGDVKANNAFQMILNNETIFAGETTDDTIDLSNGITTSGSGCIISVGDIQFKNGGGTDPLGFVVLMSLEGKVVIHQGDPIYGCVIGQEVVTMDNASTVVYTTLPSEEDGGLNFPNFEEGDNTGMNLEVRTWETS